LVSQSGSGLLTSKRLQRFTEAGVKVGELTARDPIRCQIIFEEVDKLYLLLLVLI
jgi:hypothetical protein